MGCLAGSQSNQTFTNSPGVATGISEWSQSLTVMLILFDGRMCLAGSKSNQTLHQFTRGCDRHQRMEPKPHRHVNPFQWTDVFSRKQIQPNTSPIHPGSRPAS